MSLAAHRLDLNTAVTLQYVLLLKRVSNAGKRLEGCARCGPYLAFPDGDQPRLAKLLSFGYAFPIVVVRFWILHLHLPEAQTPKSATRLLSIPPRSLLQCNLQEAKLCTVQFSTTRSRVLCSS